jgi:uncharacterized protein (DUF983 family)
MSEKPTSPPYARFSGLDVRCPKCGGRVGAKLHPEGTLYVETGDAVFGAGPEWLLRECEECGHHWPEQTADAGGGQ